MAIQCCGEHLHTQAEVDEHNRLEHSGPCVIHCFHWFGSCCKCGKTSDEHYEQAD